MPIFCPSTSAPTTDDFWFAPALACAAPPSRDDEDAGDRDGAGAAPTAIPMPFAHAQLLSGERPRSLALAGLDQDDLDDPAGCDRPGTLTAAKRRGGGSWLLGSLALLDDAAARRDARPPGLASVSDEDSSSASSCACAGDASLSSGGRRVSFAPTVAVRPIPHSSELSPVQRQRMYATTAEVRRNRARNRKEFRYDGFDWRAATEEEDMWQVDMVTGEAVHPAHYDYD